VRAPFDGRLDRGPVAADGAGKLHEGSGSEPRGVGQPVVHGDVRFGEHTGETGQSKDRHRAPVRLHWATDALDEVRREGWNALRRNGQGGAGKEFKGLRWLPLRNWENPQRRPERRDPRPVTSPTGGRSGPGNSEKELATSWPWGLIAARRCDFRRIRLSRSSCLHATSSVIVSLHGGGDGRTAVALAGDGVARQSNSAIPLCSGHHLLAR
jgi:hypothetical protein